MSEAEFVAMRRARDATLAMPQLLLPSVQVNMRAGRLPPAEDNWGSLPEDPDRRPLMAGTLDTAWRRMSRAFVGQGG